MNTTKKTRKEDLIERLLILKKETELIIEDPYLRVKINRINKGVRAYTFRCSICRFDRTKGCPKDCVFGVNKSCKDYFWHPDNNSTEKEQYQRAFDFLDILIAESQSLPEFCFSKEYTETLRSYIKNLDDIFKSEQNKTLAL